MLSLLQTVLMILLAVGDLCGDVAKQGEELGRASFMC